jgi:hypothetical protein
MATLKLNSTVAPRLPNATLEYNASMLDNENNILRLYFAQLDNFTQALLSSSGGKFLRTPYGAFQDSTSQTAVANTATAMLFNTTDLSNGVALNSGTKLQVVNAGIYNLQWSGQFQNTDNSPHDVNVWLRQGNDGGTSTNVTGSNGVIGLPQRKSVGDYFHTITGWNYFVPMNANDYVQLYWSVDSATVSMPSYPAGVSPTRPTTASVIATLSFVSALP